MKMTLLDSGVRAGARAQSRPMREGERATLLSPSAQDPVEV
jgi:hypothetical protein